MSVGMLIARDATFPQTEMKAPSWLPVIRHPSARRHQDFQTSQLGRVSATLKLGWTFFHECSDALQKVA